MTDQAAQGTLVEEAKRFAEEEIRPRARRFDEQGILDPDLIEKMAGRGLLLAGLPKEYGGLGLDPLHYGLLTEAVGRACCSTRSLITVQCSLVGESILKWGTEQQRTYWLPRMAGGQKIGAFALTEAEIGSDARSVRTRYESHGDEYTLNGAKRWTSFGDIADFFLVFAGHGGEVTAFLVERGMKGVKTRRMVGLLAGRATHIAEIEMSNVFVPAESVIGKPGGGFPFVAGTALDHGRYSIAWAGVAVAQECVEAMVRYARCRKQFDRRIGEFQLVQGMIGNAVTKTHAARALCVKAAEMRSAGHGDSVAETIIAKQFAARTAVEVAGDAVQLHGGNGCISDYPVERLYREAKILEIVEGTSQILQQMIARYGLRKYRPQSSAESR
ncbi:MAG: acyl-CoA dehydrogenase family protein [Deltaproteobacteria bacterium]|nr:acyl-CoA dehydrogenase family protein [Deltaproteobacteria bacterium]